MTFDTYLANVQPVKAPIVTLNSDFLQRTFLFQLTTITPSYENPGSFIGCDISTIGLWKFYIISKLFGAIIAYSPENKGKKLEKLLQGPREATLGELNLLSHPNKIQVD